MSEFKYKIIRIVADGEIVYDRVYGNAVEQCKVKMDDPPSDGFYQALDKLVPFVVENHLLSSEWENAEVRRISLFPTEDSCGFAVTIRLRWNERFMSVTSNKFVDASANMAADIIDEIIENTIGYIESMASRNGQLDLLEDVQYDRQ